MRIEMAAALCALAVLASAGLSAAQTSTPGWSYGYVEGAAIATHTDSDGDVVATIICRPPDGVMVLSDYSFGRGERRATSATVRIGQMSINVPATSEGRGGGAHLAINLPQRPPVLAGVQREDALSVTVNDVTHSYGAGSGKQMEDVAYACWQGGS